MRVSGSAVVAQPAVRARRAPLQLDYLTAWDNKRLVYYESVLCTALKSTTFAWCAQARHYVILPYLVMWSSEHAGAPRPPHRDLPKSRKLHFEE